MTYPGAHGVCTLDPRMDLWATVPTKQNIHQRTSRPTKIVRLTLYNYVQMLSQVGRRRP